MTYTRQEMNRKRLSLPSGSLWPINLAPKYATPKSTMSPKGFKTMASCQPSMG